MKKQKVEIAHSLKSNSANIIWGLIGTAEGMARWIADEVVKKGDQLTFTWGNTWSHHEIRNATITAHEKRQRIRFKWENEEDGDAYVELNMERGMLTNDYTLYITDFAYPEDVDGLRNVWNDNMEKLHRSSGL